MTENSSRRKGYTLSPKMTPVMALLRHIFSMCIPSCQSSRQMNFCFITTQENSKATTFPSCGAFSSPRRMYLSWLVYYYLEKANIAFKFISNEIFEAEGYTSRREMKYAMYSRAKARTLKPHFLSPFHHSDHGHILSRTNLITVHL